MIIPSRIAFLVTCSEELKFELKFKRGDLSKHFDDHILVTDFLEQEHYFTGAKEAVVSAAKQTYIKEVVNSLDLSFEEMREYFGEFTSDIHLFDKWWSIRSMECSDIPIASFITKV